jgi:hypothetical protein
MDKKYLTRHEVLYVRFKITFSYETLSYIIDYLDFNSILFID